MTHYSEASWLCHLLIRCLLHHFADRMTQSHRLGQFSKLLLTSVDSTLFLQSLANSLVAFLSRDLSHFFLTAFWPHQIIKKWFFSYLSSSRQNDADIQSSCLILMINHLTFWKSLSLTFTMTFNTVLAKEYVKYSSTNLIILSLLQIISALHVDFSEMRSRYLSTHYT